MDPDSGRGAGRVPEVTEALLGGTWLISSEGWSLLKHQSLGVPVSGGQRAKAQRDCMRRVLALTAGHRLVTVGDVVTLRALEVGAQPWIGCCDLRTKRRRILRDYSAFEPHFDRCLEVNNPVNFITAEMSRAVHAGSQYSGTTLIKITGEEDLAVIPAVLMCPRGTRVLFGRRRVGVLIVSVSQATECFALEVFELFRRMETPSNRVRR